MGNTYTITDNATGKSIELPGMVDGQDIPAIDISTLYRDHGILTFDPGFQSTASCRSQIT